VARIEHIALWVDNLDAVSAFYLRAFGARVSSRYVNAAKGFESCFLTFESGARIELMRTSRLSPMRHAAGAERMGLTHFAISLGSETAVNELTARLRAEGISVLDGPRRTGDGYYESVVLDPEGNRIEITA
jgi:lactoylglutathione lyase